MGKKEKIERLEEGRGLSFETRFQTFDDEATSFSVLSPSFCRILCAQTFALFFSLKPVFYFFLSHYPDPKNIAIMLHGSSPVLGEPLLLLLLFFVHQAFDTALPASPLL